LAKSHLPEDRPAFSAAVAALVYMAIAAIYILISGRIAAAFAGSLQQLQMIETLKGIAFVAVTGLLFFFISLGWWRTTRRQRNLLVQSERHAVAAMYSATLAHDLNNLLMSLSGLVGEIKEHEKGGNELSDTRESVEKAIQSLAPFSKRIASMATHMQPSEKTAVVLPLALTQIVELARKHPDVRLCNIRVDAAPQVVVQLNKELLEQAVLNLIVNAAQAAGPRGTIEILAKRVDDSMAIEIHDSGPGIPSDKALTIFAPGYTTKSDGTGLGLLSVKAFAAASLATVSIDRSPLGGAVFQFVIPLPQQSLI
jgi:two-component system sensor histidine kinase HydH